MKAFELIKLCDHVEKYARSQDIKDICAEVRKRIKPKRKKNGEGFDKVAYQRDYMRDWREKQKLKAAKKRKSKRETNGAGDRAGRKAAVRAKPRARMERRQAGPEEGLAHAGDGTCTSARGSPES